MKTLLDWGPCLSLVPLRQTVKAVVVDEGKDFAPQKIREIKKLFKYFIACIKSMKVMD